MPTDAPLRRSEISVDQLVDGVRARDIATLARALTLIESHSPRHQPVADELLTRLLPLTGRAMRIGVTGVPGVGKSTFIDALGTLLVDRGTPVAVLAIDPSSGVTGGSILGDKTRMARLARHPLAFVRPSPSAGTLGGVARKTREAMLICEAAGFGTVLIETVGVGQSETIVAQMTDCLLALMLPGAGDELQAIKRGLLEVIEVLAVNKADGPMRAAAERAAVQYRSVLQSIGGRAHDPPAVFTCSALEHEGVDAIWQGIQSRHERLLKSGALEERRRRQSLHWLWAIVDDQLHRLVHTNPAVDAVRKQLEEAVLANELPAAVAAKKILEACGLS